MGGDGQSDLPSFSFLSFPSTQGGLWRTSPNAFLGMAEGGFGAGQGSGKVTPVPPGKAPGQGSHKSQKTPKREKDHGAPMSQSSMRSSQRDRL